MSWLAAPLLPPPSFFSPRRERRSWEKRGRRTLPLLPPSDRSRAPPPPCLTDIQEKKYGLSPFPSPLLLAFPSVRVHSRPYSCKGFLPLLPSRPLWAERGSLYPHINAAEREEMRAEEEKGRFPPFSFAERSLTRKDGGGL